MTHWIGTEGEGRECEVPAIVAVNGVQNTAAAMLELTCFCMEEMWL